MQKKIYKSLFVFGLLTALVIGMAGCAQTETQTNSDSASKSGDDLPESALKATEYNSPKNSVKLEWPNSNGEKYYVFYNSKDDFSTKLYISDTTNNYITKLLPIAGTYYFWVWASDEFSWAFNESEAIKTSYTLSTFDNGGVSAPENFSITPATTDDSNFTITCNPVSIENCDKTYYWFYYNRTDDPATAEYNILSEIPYKKSASFFEEGIKYYFWIKAATDNGNSDAFKISDFSKVYSCIPNPSN